MASQRTGEHTPEYLLYAHRLEWKRGQRHDAYMLPIIFHVTLGQRIELGQSGNQTHFTTLLILSSNHAFLLKCT